MSLRHGPTIDELLGDSLVQAVMRADNVEPQALRTSLADTAVRLANPRRAEIGEQVLAKPDNRQTGGVPRRACTGARPPRAARRPMRVSALLLVSTKP